MSGEACLRQVAENCGVIVNALNASGNLPYPVQFKTTIITNDSAQQVVKEANYDDSCAGIITYCHTFSSSKMWINALDKPYLHFHTQFFETIPNDAIDMDYMNLHQTAHGDREHGFIGARLRIPRKVIVGYWKDESVQRAIGKWMRAAIGVSVSKAMKVMRFGDNMRDVAVTEGDKVEVQHKLGWQVNTWPVGLLADTMRDVTKAEIDTLVAEYKAQCTIATDDIDAIRCQAREEIAMKKLMDQEGCRAFSNTFQDLYGMAQGYGYDCDVEMMRDWARMMCIEFVHIDKDTDPDRFGTELFLADLAWKLR